jgi:surfeit locus 1 family protein
MSRRRTIVALVAAVGAAALALSLGNWQLRRAQEKLALQASWDLAEQRSPQAVTAADIAAVGRHLPSRVRMSGRFIHEHEVWLDNRQMDGQAGFFLITPLRLVDGAVVLVNRGFVRRDPHERTRLAPVDRTPEYVNVEGIAVAEPPRVLQLGENAPAIKGKPVIWQNFDFEKFEGGSGLRVGRWVVQQTNSGNDGLLRNWPRLSAGVDMHRGYALQWFALAALIVALTLAFGYRALRRWREIPEPQ